MLTASTEIKIKFNEVDPLGIVWHGHYIRFFEDGREQFGSMHGLAYMDIYAKGYVVPVVKINCDYKKSLEYGDVIDIITTYVNVPAAKLIFDYKIILKKTGETIATGNSVQVFVDSKTKELQLVPPVFFEEWKKLNKLL